ncbi:hypothetical protein ACWEF9_39095, partial [Streptomyces sp. NPDC004980]
VVLICCPPWQRPAERRYGMHPHRQLGMIAATEQPATRLCTACFTGDYPIPLPQEAAIGKNVLEGMLSGQPESKLLGENVNVDALSRP